MLANRTYLNIFYLRSFLVFTAVSPAVKEPVHWGFNACTMASESHLKNTSHFLFIHEVWVHCTAQKHFLYISSITASFQSTTVPTYFCLLSFHLCFWFLTGKMQRRNHTQVFVLVLHKNLVNNNLATTKSLKSWDVALKERFWFNKKKKKIESSLNDENYIVLSRQAFQIFQIVLPLSFLDKRCWDWLLVGSALQLFWLCLQCNIHPKKMHQLK